MLVRYAVNAAFIFATGLGALIPAQSFAQTSYYSSMCSSCHGATPAFTATCNGCHAHGTHAITGSASARNLIATTDKTSYTVGETIKVTLNGGSKGNTDAWVGVRIYDATGAEVSTRQRSTMRCSRNPASNATRCDTPAEISVTAQAGWTDLYVAWAGNEYDSMGASKGATISGVIGVGSRPLKDAGGNQIAGHIEEVVKTAAFTVSNSAPVNSSGGSSGGSSAGSASSSAAGGGAMDWALMLGVLGVSFLGWKSKRSAVVSKR